MSETNEKTRTRSRKGLALTCLCCCMVCLLLLTSVCWSWFNDAISASFKMNTATYDIEILVETQYGEVSPSEESEYVYNLEADTTYTVTVTTSGTAQNGYFDLTVGNLKLTSGNLVNGQITFVVNTAEQAQDLTVSPSWGTRSGDTAWARIVNNATYYL